ncbi:MAG: hypothetical protein HQL51_08495 [Magnetococcales bacterium]|nr:hypothetical protein [Magnetococcales bacterium]
MSALFSRLTLGVLMRSVSMASMLAFVLVIALNYLSIGVVQRNNDELKVGPLKTMLQWNEIAVRLGDVERQRNRFLRDRQPATAEQAYPIIQEMNGILGEMSGGEVSAAREMLANYDKIYREMTKMAADHDAARKQLVKNREAIEEVIYEQDNPGLERALGEFLLAEMGYFADPVAEKAQSVLVLLDRVLRDSAGKPMEAQFRKVVGTYRETFQRMVELTQTIRELALSMEDIAQRVQGGVRQDQQKANSQAMVALDHTAVEAEQSKRRALTWTIIGVLFAIVLSEGFQFALRRRVMTTLEGLEILGAGDLRHRYQVIEGARNEMCRILLSINRMADGLTTLHRTVQAKAQGIDQAIGSFVRVKDSLLSHSTESAEMIQQVTEKNDVVDECTRKVFNLSERTEEMTIESEQAAKEFAKIIHTVAAASEQASVNVSTMAAAAEEMTANVAEVHHNMERVSRSVGMTATSVKELDNSLEAVRRRCKAADDAAREAGRHVQSSHGALGRLEESAREIGKVVEMIKRIAEQTNMLALNASIEAAGAGESGKGFAVVANEVKELAKGTADATRLISQRIEEIKGSAQEVSGAMRHVVEGIDQVVSATVEISHAMDEQSGASREIAASMAEVNQAADLVTLNTAELAQAAQDVARSASEAALGAGEIARSTSYAANEVQRVVDISGLIETQSREVKEKTGKIFTASADVQKVGLGMLEIIQLLHHQAEQVAGLSDELRGGVKALKKAAEGFTIGEEGETRQGGELHMIGEKISAASPGQGRNPDRWLSEDAAAAAA